MAGVLLFVLLGILAGILTLVSVVFTIISFANSGKNKFVWLCIFIASLIAMIVCVFFAASKTARSAKNFAQGLQTTFDVNDSLAYKEYNFADSLNSKQIQYLKVIEPAEYRDAVPDQFYNYLGYRDYYRMPLRYPFSLHCEDVLDKATLFNEKDVIDFGVNDNGEEDCKIKGITHFNVDPNILLAKVNKRDLETNEDYFIVYHFSDGKTEKFTSLEEAEARARKLQFPTPIKLFSCREYYELLK